MPAVLSVATWRPHPGKSPEVLANFAAAKKIVERLGGKVRTVASSFGGTPSSFGFIIEVESWTAFGAFGEKISTDPEWQTFWATASAHPSAELIQQSVVTELHV